MAPLPATPEAMHSLRQTVRLHNSVEFSIATIANVFAPQRLLRWQRCTGIYCGRIKYIYVQVFML